MIKYNCKDKKREVFTKEKKYVYQCKWKRNQFAYGKR